MCQRCKGTDSDAERDFAAGLSVAAFLQVVYTERKNQEKQMKIVLASHNQGKQKEMAPILERYGVELVLQSDLGLHIEVEETGTTFRENALLKAQAVMRETNMPAISDDSGLMVDALDGAPGVYTARYGGEGLTDVERYRLLLNALKGQTNRAAHFYSCIVCAFPTGEILTGQGVCDGTIAFAAMGEGGFGYDPIFFVPALRKTFAQMTPEEKNQVSHRAKALVAFRNEFEKYCREKNIHVDK